MADVQILVVDDNAAIRDSLRRGLTFEGYEERTAVDEHIEVGPECPRLGYVELDGTGPPLVFLHGLGSSSPIYFTRTATDPALAGRRVLMIDFLVSV